MILENLAYFCEEYKEGGQKTVLEELIDVDGICLEDFYQIFEDTGGVDADKNQKIERQEMFIDFLSECCERSELEANEIDFELGSKILTSFCDEYAEDIVSELGEETN